LEHRLSKFVSIVAGTVASLNGNLKLQSQQLAIIATAKIKLPTLSGDAMLEG
jgi:hypothetical protein